MYLSSRLPTLKIDEDQADNLAEAMCVLHEVLDAFRPVIILPNGLAITASPQSLALHDKIEQAYILIHNVITNL